VWSLGATALQEFNPASGQMELKVTADELLERAALPPGIEARVQHAFPYRWAGGPAAAWRAWAPRVPLVSVGYYRQHC
jgi:hypothetical protein